MNSPQFLQCMTGRTLVSVQIISIVENLTPHSQTLRRQIPCFVDRESMTPLFFCPHFGHETPPFHFVRENAEQGVDGKRRGRLLLDCGSFFGAAMT
jgi:hypothetical protein